MKRIEDERIRFYLKHRQQIEEWVKVRENVLDFAHEFYRSLEEDIRSKVREREIDVEISVHKLGIRLRRHDWPAAEEGPAVELGWHAGRYHGGFSRDDVWCGIWTAPNTYFEKLSQARERPEAKSYPRRERASTYGYPMYEYLAPPAGNFWEDDKLLEAYGNSVIEAVLQAWRDLAPLVDEAVEPSNP